MKVWKCKKCGHIVLAEDKPQPIYWTDGHICEFEEAKRQDIFGIKLNEKTGRYERME